MAARELRTGLSHAAEAQHERQLTPRRTRRDVQEDRTRATPGVHGERWSPAVATVHSAAEAVADSPAGRLTARSTRTSATVVAARRRRWGTRGQTRARGLEHPGPAHEERRGGDHRKDDELGGHMRQVCPAGREPHARGVDVRGRRPAPRRTARRRPGRRVRARTSTSGSGRSRSPHRARSRQPTRRRSMHPTPSAPRRRRRVMTVFIAPTMTKRTSRAEIGLTQRADHLSNCSVRRWCARPTVVRDGK